jgi:hypothetical protein
VEKLAHGWNIINRGEYIVYGLVLQLWIRIFMMALSTIILANRETRRSSDWRFGRLGELSAYFTRSFFGFHPNDLKREKSNYGFTAILGLLELYSYPVLMATGSWTVIGAWLGFKTVAQWRAWSDDRVIFNHYLIGNALVVLSSLIFLVPYVET